MNFMFLNAKYMLYWKEPKVEECWGIFITYNLVSTHSLTAPLLPRVSSLRGSRGYFTKPLRKAPGRVTTFLRDRTGAVLCGRRICFGGGLFYFRGVMGPGEA